MGILPDLKPHLQSIHQNSKRTLDMLRRVYFVEILVILIVLGTVGIFMSLYATSANRPTRPIVFQGKLTNASYVPVSDSAVTYYLRFKIYDTSGTCVWATGTVLSGANCPETTSTFASTPVTVNRGLFAVELGSYDAGTFGTTNMPQLNLDFETSTSYSIGVTVCGTAAGTCTESEMSPRFRLGSSTYAYNADLFDGQESADFPLQNIGRAGSRIIVGGSALNETLTLRATSATSGNTGTNSALTSLVGNATTGTGTVSSSGATVTGSGSAFTTELRIGDQIIASGQTRTVTALSSATSLTTDTAFSPVISGGTAFTYVRAALTILHNTNVGIGAGDPNTALDINGALSVRGMAAPALSVAGQGRIYFDSTSNTFKMSQHNGAYTDLGSGTWSSLSVPTTALTLAHGAYSTTFSYNTIAAGSALTLSSTSTVGTGSDTTRLLNLSKSGVNANATHTSYGLYSSITNTGTTSTNVGAYVTASGATNNYGLIVENGHTGMGVTTPTGKLHVQGAGTVNGTGTVSSSGTTVTGASSTFTTQLNVGDVIIASEQTRTVTALTSATVLTTDIAFNPALGASTAYTFQQPITKLATSAGTTNVHVTAQGNVGIGTTTPAAQLAVAGSLPTTHVGAISTGGTSGVDDIFVQGRYAYMVDTDGNRLLIYDISNSTTPLLINGTGTATGTTPRDIFVQGRYAYIANQGSNTLQIFDVSNPAAPVSVGTATSTSARSVTVQGQYAYVARVSSPATLQIFDVSNPSSPTLIGSRTTGDTARSLNIQGRYAYVVTGTAANSFQIFDVSDPTIATGADANVANTSLDTLDVTVQGRYAYLTLTDYGSTHLLKIYDVSNPASPVAVNGSGTATASFPEKISVQGRYAYVTINAANGALQVFDISNPASPLLINTLTQNSTNGFRGLFVQGRYAYVSLPIAQEFRIFDLGGATIQQLESGGFETGTGTVRNNFSIFNDLDVKGGAVIGNGGLQSQGALSLNAPTPPSVTSATGTNAGATLTVLGAIGGSTSIATTGTGGIGGGLTLTGGTGGSANSATTASTGGVGGGVFIFGGTGGAVSAAGGTKTGGNGGNLTLNGGPGGGALGAGTNIAGLPGYLLLATNGGNVGIGTVTPFGVFDVYADTGTTTTLTAAISSTSSTGNISIAPTTGFPVRGTLVIDNEAITYTTVSGTVLNITARGVLGTTGATHANGSTVQYLETLVSKGTGTTPHTVLNSSGNMGIGTVSPSTNARLAFKDGHIQSQQATAPGIAAGAAAGTGPTVSLSNATDVAGKVNVTTGTGTSTGTVTTITFSTPFATAPIITLMPANAQTATQMDSARIYTTSTTTTFSVISGASGAALTASTAYAWWYHVTETQ